MPSVCKCLSSSATQHLYQNQNQHRCPSKPLVQPSNDHHNMLHVISAVPQTSCSPAGIGGHYLCKQTSRMNVNERSARQEDAGLHMHGVLCACHSIVMHFATFAGSDIKALNRIAKLELVKREMGGLGEGEGVQIVGNWWMEGGMGIVDVSKTAVIVEAALPSQVLSEEHHHAVSKKGDHVLVIGALEIGHTNQE